MKITQDYKLYFSLVIGFMLFTVIGTLSHELGHFTMAKLLGYNARINYGYTFWEEKPGTHSSVQPFRVMDQGSYLLRMKKQKEEKDSFWITLAGPVQTMLTGTTGLLLLIRNKRRTKENTVLYFKQWLLLFISLFWLRQLFNFCTGIFVYLSRGNFPVSNDEAELALNLHWPVISISLITALIATGICSYLFFRVIPKVHRFTFICSGLTGGLLGFFLWFRLLGPVMMP